MSVMGRFATKHKCGLFMVLTLYMDCEMRNNLAPLLDFEQGSICIINFEA